jgi:peptidoglycan hydrolase-like protein with peptidoglycan-binding domain
MGGPSEINVSRVRSSELNATVDSQSGRIRDLLLVNLSTLQIQGDFSPRDLERLQRELSDTAGSDTSEARDRIAARADVDPAAAANQTDAATTPAATQSDAATTPESDSALRPPEAYALGRYTDAATDADAREGFRGDRVRAVQQRLVDEGHLTGENAVDGMWGPETQAAFQRSQSAAQTATPAENADQTTRRLTDDIRAGNTDAVTNTLAGSTNAQIREIDSRLPRNEDGTYSTRLPNVAGDDSDFADYSNMVLRGRRNEGTAARPDAGVIDDFQEQILRARVSPLSRDLGATSNIGSAWNGTDEDSINRVFSRASREQLQALDQRIRTGVRDENGDMVRFSDGLTGLINSEIGAGAHRDALLAQLRRE